MASAGFFRPASATPKTCASRALLESGLLYRVHALDHTGGELDTDAYAKISPFRQAPAIDDDGFVVAESGRGAALYRGKSGKLIPSTFRAAHA